MTMTVVLHAPDISCDHCKTHIEADLSELAGVLAVSVDVGRKTVTVDIDTTTCGPERVREALDAAGYPAEPVDRQGQPPED